MVFGQSFPAECFEDILRHLSGKDLLKCTLVSPKWDSFIGSSRSCMEKIKLLCLNRYNNLDDMNEILKNSMRKYTRLTLQGDYFGRVADILLMNGRTWTHIQFNASFEKLNDVLDFLRTVEFSAQDLYFDWHPSKIGSELAFKSEDWQFP